MTSTSYEMNIFGQIALVMLIGMAAKNAILIVEFANIEFQKGLSLYDAAIKAAQLRFRPILMTAFSFILGVMPLVVASGAGAEARIVMGVALLGGMTRGDFPRRLFLPHAVYLHRQDSRLRKKARPCTGTGTGTGTGMTVK